MARLVYALAPRKDVRNALEDLAQKAGQRVAVEYGAKFKQSGRDLALFPDGGALRPELGGGIRIGAVRPYLMIYRHIAGDNVVTVLRIVVCAS